MLHLTFIFLYCLVGFAIFSCGKNLFFPHEGDVLPVISVFVILYLILPPIVIHSIFFFSSNDLITGNNLLDTAFSNFTALNEVLIFLGTCFFLIGLYGSARINRNLITNYSSYYQLSINYFLSFIILSLGFLISLKFIFSFGDHLKEILINIIRFRALDPGLERTFFTANAFALFQTFLWLASAIFICTLKNKKFFFSFFILFSLITFAFCLASRRALIFPIVIIFLISLFKEKINLKYVFIFSIFSFLIIGYGKYFFSNLVNPKDIIYVYNIYNSFDIFLLRCFSDIGLSYIESLLTFQNLDKFDYPRYGIDHLLSLVKFIPDESIGLNIDWPERIVRISTRIFLNDEQNDIPPGLIGQAWLDFPFLGALLFGVLIGIQARAVNHFLNRIEASYSKYAIIVLLGLVIALPINTGSYDFTFSIDIFFLLLFMLFIFKLKLKIPK